MPDLPNPMAPDWWTKKYWPDLDSYLKDMWDAGASERVIAIIGGTMLDLILRRLLVAFFIEDKVVSELVGDEDSGGDKPLSTFSARINVCYALGLITTDERKALDTIRRIRNAFAHRLSNKISEASLSDLFKNLAILTVPSSAWNEFATDPREATLRGCLLSLAITLGRRIQEVEAERRKLLIRENTMTWRKVLNEKGEGYIDFVDSQPVK